MTTSRLALRKKKLIYVVLVPRGKTRSEVYGPYRVKDLADSDAKDWGGTVKPMLPRAFH